MLGRNGMEKKMIRFRCPECGEIAEVFKHVSEITRVYVDDIGNGPELWESDISRYNATYYECGECEYRFPCINEDRVTKYILKHSEKEK